MYCKKYLLFCIFLFAGLFSWKPRSPKFTFPIWLHVKFGKRCTCMRLAKQKWVLFSEKLFKWDVMREKNGQLISAGLYYPVIYIKRIWPCYQWWFYNSQQMINYWPLQSEVIVINSFYRFYVGVLSFSDFP